MRSSRSVGPGGRSRGYDPRHRDDPPPPEGMSRREMDRNRHRGSQESVFSGANNFFNKFKTMMSFAPGRDAKRSDAGSEAGDKMEGVPAGEHAVGSMVAPARSAPALAPGPSMGVGPPPGLERRDSPPHPRGERERDRDSRASMARQSRNASPYQDGRHGPPGRGDHHADQGRHGPPPPSDRGPPYPDNRHGPPPPDPRLQQDRHGPPPPDPRLQQDRHVQGSSGQLRNDSRPPAEGGRGADVGSSRQGPPGPPGQGHGAASAPPPPLMHSDSMGGTVKDLQHRNSILQSQVQEVDELKRKLQAEQRLATEWKEKWNFQVWG